MEQNNKKKKNLITINEKLVVDETDSSFYTRIPFCKDNYVEFSKENCKWLSDKTMQVEVKDSDTIHKIQKETSLVNGREEEHFSRTGSTITGEELKKHYDEVLERQSTLVSEKSNDTASVIEFSNLATKEKTNEIEVGKYIHCASEAEAQTLLTKLDDMGVKWFGSDSLASSHTMYNSLTDRTCYGIIGNQDNSSLWVVNQPLYMCKEEDLIEYSNIDISNLEIKGREPYAQYRDAEWQEVIDKLDGVLHKEQVVNDISKIDEFDIHTYKNEESLKFFPEELRQDKEFIQAVTYKEMQENYLKQYINQNSNTSNISDAIEHTKGNIALANVIISEKIDAHIEQSKILDSASQSFKDNFSTIDKDYFKSLSPELQQSETFREVYSLYSAQENYCKLLKNTIDCYQDHIQTLVNSDKMSDKIAAYNVDDGYRYAMH